MATEVRKRRRGFTRLSRKLQVNIPKAAIEAAGLDVGDVLKVEAAERGRLVITRVLDPIEEIERFAQAHPDLFRGGRQLLRELRDEWPD